MKLRPNHLDWLAAVLLAAAALNGVIAVTGDSRAPRESLALGLVWAALGVAALWWRRHLPEAEVPPAEAVVTSPSARPGGETFSLVLIAGEQAVKSPLYDQFERKLVERIAAAPRFPLTPDATVRTLRGPQLPGRTKEDLEPFVWSLQSNYGRRGSRWQADFYDEFGFSFLVLYLE